MTPVSKLIELPFDKPGDLEKLWGLPQIETALLEYVRSCIKLLPEITLLDDMTGPVSFVATKSRGTVVAQASSFRVMLMKELNPLTIAEYFRNRRSKEVSLYRVSCGNDPRMDFYIRSFIVT